MRPPPEVWIGPEQLPFDERGRDPDGSPCLLLAVVGGLVLAFVVGLLLGILVGRA